MKVKKDLNIILKQAIYYPENNLSDDVLLAISNQEAKSRMIKLWAYSSVTILSILALIPAINDLSKQFSNSGFYEYFSMAFSNNGLALYYWKEFMLSIIDSLPVISLIFSLALILILITSARSFLRQFAKRRLLAI